jgi:hypothetical protein
MVFEPRRAVLAVGRQCDPRLQPVHTARLVAFGGGCALGVRDTGARGHPVDVTALDRLHRAGGIAVHEPPFEEVRQRRQPEMGVRVDVDRNSRGQIIGTDVVGEDERSDHAVTAPRQQPMHDRIADGAFAGLDQQCDCICGHVDRS